MRNIAKYLVYYFYSKIIIFSLLLNNLKKKKYLYSDHFGFGDFCVYCYVMSSKIKKKKIFCFSKLQYEIATFFFEKKYIETSFLLLPRSMNESHIGYNFLSKNNNFKPTKTPYWISPKKIKIPTHDYFLRSEKLVRYMKSRINMENVSENIISVFKKPSLLLFIKNFSQKKNNHLNFQVRQTRNLKKIFKLINFLNKKKMNIVILGNKKDHFIQLITNVKKIENWKNVYLFKDLSSNYSINDQVYVASKSKGYIGSASGGNVFSVLLMKNILLIDCPYYYVDKYWKRVKCLYKKIYNIKKKKSEVFYWQKYYNPKEYKLIENNFREIKKEVKKKFLK